VLQETVPEFLERNPNPLPSLMTVERTKTSSYQFYFLVRHYRKRVDAVVHFFTYAKGELGAVRGIIEEHSVFGGKDIYVLEGFGSKFVETLVLPDNATVLAETDGGELKVEPQGYRGKRPILKVLYKQLGLSYHKDEKGKSILTQRGLIALDWSSLRSYSLWEPFLRKAKILAWSNEDVEKELFKTSGGNLLTLIKRGQFKGLFAMAEKYGYSWTYNHVVELLSELIHYRALRVMGYDEGKCARELGANERSKRARELEEANQMLTSSDLGDLTDRVVDLDPLVMRNPKLGFSLFVLNAPIRVH